MTRFRRVALGTIVVCLIASCAVGSEPILIPAPVPDALKTPITLEQALQVAFQNSPDIQAALSQVESSRGGVDEARARFNPTFSIQASTTFQGPVSTMQISGGQVVSPGQTLANVVNLGSVYFKAEVSEKYLAQVSNGQPVSVRIDASPDHVFQGSVSEIYPSGSTSNRNFSVRISISKADSKIKPGMFASGEILTGKLRGVVLVPKDAVDDQEGTQSVFIVGQDNTAKRRAGARRSEGNAVMRL